MQTRPIKRPGVSLVSGLCIDLHDSRLLNDAGKGMRRTSRGVPGARSEATSEVRGDWPSAAILLE